MKYIVMECHEGYAVLMDEESSFVHAANLHYEVGQTVTDPVIMGSEKEQTVNRNNIVMKRIAAAAACAILICAGGVHYYSMNYKTHSTIMISSEAEISMILNKKGEVISLESSSQKGKELLKEYNGKSKDSSTVANELLELEISKGIISNGDTVELFISTDDPSDYNKYSDELKKNLSELDIKVNVKEKSAAIPAIKETPPVPAPPAEAPAPDVNKPKAADPLTPDPKADVKKPAAADPKSDAVSPPAPKETPAEDKPVPPPPPSTPESDKNREEKHDAIEKDKKTPPDASAPAPPSPDNNGNPEPPQPKHEQGPADKSVSEEKPPVPPEGDAPDADPEAVVSADPPAPAPIEAPPPAPPKAKEVL
ncbi:MAG TPA: hypothetical protein PLS20_02485 [Ruminococcus flavefaciens]|nr:hypothetical protein [Ruminococcus flavefaciens]